MIAMLVRQDDANQAGKIEARLSRPLSEDFRTEAGVQKDGYAAGRNRKRIASAAGSEDVQPHRAFW